ncbi:MAG: hypothetical protein IIA83_08355, partial [Thaumarchaeota archaeon]|nr:hypothetical protein [Nitrososphaerota archaeon]
MKIQSNIFFVLVMILALIISPLSFSGFAFAQEDSEEPNLDESVQVSDAAEDAAEAADEAAEDAAEESDEAAEDAVETTEDVDTTINPDTVSNLGQEVSNFVHESRDLFKLQKIETKVVIAQCREDMKNAEPSERQSVREECRSNLDAIKESYKSLRETYRETYKAFREDMKVFIQEYKGLPIDDSTRAAAIASIESLPDNAEKRELLRELQQKMNEEVREDKHKLREQMKKEREIAREELKSEREAIREALKSEQENAREALKAEKEMIREQEQKDREAERE